MKDNSSPDVRYPDLFEKDEAADPALERLLADLETIYPPASYPASLPEQLLSTLETHQERRESSLAERPLASAPAHPRLPRHTLALPEKRWQRGLNSLAAVALTMLLISSLLFVLRASRLAGNTPGTGHGQPSTPTTLLAIAMMDSRNGWAWANDGHGSLLHTTDGGQSWQNVTPSHLTTPGYDMPPQFDPTSATSAWLSSGGKTNQGVLFHTTNGGQSWQRVALPDPLSRPFSFTEHFFYLHFLNDLVGWISMQPDHSFWSTTDGGQSWHHLTLPSNATQWGLITFFDAKTWLFTTTPSGSSTTTVNGRPIIYLTRNAGKSWQKQVLPVPAGFSFRAAMENARSFSASDGKLAVADGGEDILIYTTHDGGDSWQVSPPLSPDIIHRSYELGLPAFSSMNDGQFFLAPIPAYGKLPAPIYLVVTHDGGQHWQVITVQLPLVQQKQAGASDRAGSYCEFVSPRVGWLLIAYSPSRAGLPRNGLYKTTDGGQTWMPISYQIESHA